MRLVGEDIEVLPTDYSYTQIVEGFHAQQVQGFQKVFYEFKRSLGDSLPARVIEIGTAGGGFALFLKRLFPEAVVTTIDISNSLLQGKEDELLNAGIILVTGDVFDSYTSKLIQSPGLTLLFCDGGNKPKEFNTFASYLKQGDFIFAHDYARDAEGYEKLKAFQTWHWWETSEESIAETCRLYDLQPYMQQEFMNIVWACRRKK